MAELHVVGDYFLPRLDWQMTGDAVRREMIFLANNETEQGREPLRLLHGEVPLPLVGLVAVVAERAALAFRAVPPAELFDWLDEFAGRTATLARLGMHGSGARGISVRSGALWLSWRTSGRGSRRRNRRGWL